jgi:hypothetical protein
MTDQQAVTNSQRLEGYLQVREQKMQRNYDRYFSNGIRRDTIHNLYGQPLAYYFNSLEEDQGAIPVLNGIKNAVDTVVSKFVSTKVRPFVNAIDGTFATRKAARELQIGLDYMFEKQKIYQKAGLVLRDALLFETGHLWVDEETKTVRHVRPWEVYYDPSQYHYDQMCVLKLRFRQYPVYALIECGKMKKSDPLYQGWLQDPLAVCAYNVHYDLEGGFRRDIVNGRVIHKSEVGFDCVPVTFLYYNPPVKGVFSTSLADDLFTLQTQVDTLSFRIHAAVEISPANTVFVPKGSGVKPSMVSNQIGNVVETNPAPNGMLPITVSTPRPIDPMYKELLDYFLDKMLSMSGISKMSANAQKPSGDPSGEALKTLESLETDRWNMVLNNVIQNFMNLKDIWIEVMPKSEPILPREDGRSKVTYGDVRKQMSKMHIQFSAASNLSKDPKTKLEQIYIMDQMGLINPNMKASLLEIPDLEGAFSIATASYDYCQSIIQRAVEHEDYEYYPIVDLKQLFGEVQNAVLRFDSAGDTSQTLDRLVKLLKKVMEDMGKVNATGAPHPLPPQPGSPPMPGTPTPPTPGLPGTPGPIGGKPITPPEPVPTIPVNPGPMNPQPQQGGLNG